MRRHRPGLIVGGMTDRLDIAECRAHAGRMRHRARATRNPELRAGYQAMALAYDKLIADMEEQIRQRAAAAAPAARRASLDGLLF